MTALLIAWLVTLPGMIAVGYGLGRRSARTRIPKHEHAWDQWHTIPVDIHDTTTGKLLYARSGQYRTCIGCGRRQIDWVTNQ